MADQTHWPSRQAAWPMVDTFSKHHHISLRAAVKSAGCIGYPTCIVKAVPGEFSHRKLLEDATGNGNLLPFRVQIPK